MKLTLEDILTISATEYCKMYDRDLDDYRPIGIHFEKTYTSRPFSFYDDFLEYVSKMKENIEVIVSFNSEKSIAAAVHSRDCKIIYGYSADATALVPRKKKNK